MPTTSALALDALLERFSFPERFTFGASTAGYQVEGWHNGPDEPKNNWYPAERDGRAATSGTGARFWERWPEDVAAARWLGLGMLRLGIEWSRLQPQRDPTGHEPPPFDEQAAERYAALLDGVYGAGLTPAVTLHHFTHPLWAGPDLWLDRDAVRCLLPAYARWALTALNERLIGHGRPPLPYLITVNEPAMLAMSTYLLGVFPRGGAARGPRPALAALENLLIAHVLLYREIHALYRERGWPRPTVTLNTWCAGLYHLDRLLQDLLLARRNRVARDDLPAWLAEQRADFEARARPLPHAHGPRALKRCFERFLDQRLQRGLQRAPFTGLLDLIYEGDEPELLDAVAFDYYDPQLGNYWELFRPWPLSLRVKPWQWLSTPRHLGAFLASYQRSAAGLPLHILENGLCHRHDGRRAYPRPDGARRDQELRATVLAMLEALAAGVPLQAYCYWSLIDNYEWGSFEPRFGLFGVDYAAGARRLPTDIAGNNAAGLYRLVCEAFAARDKRLLRAALEADAGALPLRPATAPAMLVP